MKIFVDSGDLQEIVEVCDSGFVSGITTNPKLLGGNIQNALDIYHNTGYKLSYQPKNYEKMQKEIKDIFDERDKLILKIPPRIDYFQQVRKFIKDGLDVNVTLGFSINQAILAGNLGAKYVSIFVGRLEDSGENPFEIINQIRNIYDKNNIKTEIIAASIRNVDHVQKIASAGAHIATIPTKFIYKMFDHDLTKKGIVDFEK